MISARHLFVGLLIVASASHSWAQTSTGTLVPGRTTTSPVQTVGNVYDPAEQDKREASQNPKAFKKALKTAREMAKCAARRKPVVVINYLGARSQQEYTKVFRGYKNALSECLGRTFVPLEREITIALSSYTNHAVQSEAYLQTYGVPTLQPLPISELTASDEYRTASFDYQLAACLTYSQPSLAAAVVMSEPDSPAEQSAFSDLTPHVSACVPRGSTLNFAKTWLRLRLATSLYLRAPAEKQRSQTAVTRKAK